MPSNAINITTKLRLNFLSRLLKRYNYAFTLHQHEKYFYVTNNIREKYLCIDGGGGAYVWLYVVIITITVCDQVYLPLLMPPH